MYTYGYNYPSVASSAGSSSTVLAVTTIVALVVAIIGSVLLFVLFLKKDNENKFTGITNWLYNFLQFNKLTIETILKFTYLFLAIFLTVFSFGLIAESFVAFLFVLVLGNLTLRVTYELIMVQILIHRNVREINEKLKK